MKSNFFKSPAAYKWGLFVCLLGSLGFNLSMNPEHTNIARNSFSTVNFASEEAPVDVAGKKQSFNVGGRKGNFKVDVVEVAGVTVAKFNPITEGQACDLCGTTRPISASLNDQAALMQELVSIANEGVDKAAPEVAEVPEVKPAKPGEALNVDLEQYAAKCEGKEDMSLMECHSNQLLKLSKDLKNDRDQAELVTEYFKEHLERDLRGALAVNRANVEFGSFSEEHDFYETARSLAQDLVSGLESKNGEKVRSIVIRMRANSIYQQTELSKNSIVSGLETNNLGLINMGRQNLASLQREYIYDAMGFKSGLADSPGMTASMNSALKTNIDSLFNPMSSMFKTINEKYLWLPANLQYSRVGIEELAKIQIAAAVDGSPIIVADPTIPGSGVPSGIVSARIGVIRGGTAVTTQGQPQSVILVPQGTTVQGTGIPSITGAQTLPGTVNPNMGIQPRSLYEQRGARN